MAKTKRLTDHPTTPDYGSLDEDPSPSTPTKHPHTIFISFPSQHRAPSPISLSKETHLNQIHLCKVLQRTGFDNIQDGNDVLVIEPSEEFDLAKRTKAEHCEAVGVES